MDDDITQYRSLAWDFDQTLWGHANSSQFWDYIQRNPHNQTHHIVTFRTGRLLDRLWYDLANVSCTLMPLHFGGIHGVPEETYEAMVNAQVGGDEYFFWKGRVCRELGIECLIDDATVEVWAGCSKYEIAYCHPDMVGFVIESRSVTQG